MCNFNDEEIYLTGSEDNIIVILDCYFQVIRQVSTIGEMQLHFPSSICTDSSENIYICDYGNQRVLIVDRNFSEVKRVIGKLGSSIGEFVDPFDMCFFSNALYVLDREIKRIQEFTRAGDFVREIKLYEAYRSNANEKKLILRPVRLGITNGLIAVLDSFKKVYIYTIKGEMRQIIETGCNMIMLLTSDYLFTCNRHGVLTCYEKSHENQLFQTISERSIEILKSSKSFMSLFDNHLILLLSEDRNLVVL
jgi:hypothetical protein